MYEVLLNSDGRVTSLIRKPATAAPMVTESPDPVASACALLQGRTCSVQRDRTPLIPGTIAP